MPKIIENIEQGSSTWIEYRKNKIGSSEAAIILGISKYGTPFTLWQRKLGLIPEQEETCAMLRGKELEPIAREMYEKEIDILMTPMVLESIEYPFLIASVDGISVNLSRACEIKCLNLEDHLNGIKGNIKPIYMAQMQHIMYVCNLNEMDYVGYHPDAYMPFYVLRIIRDEAFLADYIPKAQAFWECVQTFTPPPLIEKDYLDFTKNAEYAALDAAYIDVDEKLKGLEKQKEEIRKLMEAMSEGNNVIGPYTKMTHYTSQGRIDYKKAVTENLPELDIEGYRGKLITAIRITKV